VEAATHRVNEYVSGLQMRRCLRVTALPAFETCQRIVFFLGAADLDQRMLRDPSLRGLDASRFVWLFLVVRRPWRITEALLLVTGRELQQRNQ
jgi:hypothetical protein